jgi:hypothetical protein
VTVDLLDTTDATITLTTLNSVPAGYQYLAGSVGVNVNASSWTVNTPTGTPFQSGQGGSFSNKGVSNQDGFGSFNQVFEVSGGFNNTYKQISFTLTNTSGTWASASDVLTANNSGEFVAAHIFVANPDGSNAGATGYAATNVTPTPQQNSVPEPTTISLLGALGGLMAFVAIRRRSATA